MSVIFKPHSRSPFIAFLWKFSEVPLASCPTTTSFILLFLRKVPKPLPIQYIEESLSSSSASRPRRSYSRNIVFLRRGIFFNIKYQEEESQWHLPSAC